MGKRLPIMQSQRQFIQAVSQASASHQLSSGWRHWRIRWLPEPLLMAFPALPREKQGLLWYGWKGRGLPRAHAWLILSETDLCLLLPLLLAAEEAGEHLAPCSFALLLAARYPSQVQGPAPQPQARNWLIFRSLAELEAALAASIEWWQQRLRTLADQGSKGISARVLEREKRLVRRPLQALARRFHQAGFPLTVRSCYGQGYQLAPRAIPRTERLRS